MKIRVLGCQGGILPGFRATSFLINKNILIDAGSVASELTLGQQDDVRHIFITHFHLDHTKDIAFLSDNAVGRGNLPITIYGTGDTTSGFTRYFFNEHTWPDFSEISSMGKPIVALTTIGMHEKIKIGDMELLAFPVNHDVNGVGYLVRDKKASVLFSGDTGETDALWDIANAEKNLKAIFLETSFPNELQSIADASKHLTPQRLESEIQKFKREDCPIFLYHLKPRYYDLLKKEIFSLNNKRMRILENDQVLEY